VPVHADGHLAAGPDYQFRERGIQFHDMPEVWNALTAGGTRPIWLAFIKTFSRGGRRKRRVINSNSANGLTWGAIQHEKDFPEAEMLEGHGNEGRGDGPPASTLTDITTSPFGV